MCKKSNHYVPQFYLKNFSNNKKSVGSYMRQYKKYIKEASIKKQACKDYLYGEDGRLENYLMELEKKWSKIITNIINDKIKPKRKEDYLDLLMFILVSEARNLKTADTITNQVDFLYKKILEEDPQFEMSDEEFKNMVIAPEVPNSLAIESAIKGSLYLLDLNFTILINKTDRKFITTDNPMVKYNQFYIHRNYDRGYGIANVGLQIFMPISPELCICLYDSKVYNCNLNQDGNIDIIRSKQIDEINKIIYLNSYKTIFFNDSVKKGYIESIDNSVLKYANEDQIEVGEFDSNIGPIIRFSNKKITYKMKLPIFTIKKDFITMKLPEHMAGPMREWGYVVKNIDFDKYIKREQ